MNNRISDNIRNILVCPHCGAILDHLVQKMTCKNCQTDYKYLKFILSIAVLEHIRFPFFVMRNLTDDVEPSIVINELIRN